MNLKKAREYSWIFLCLLIFLIPFGVAIAKTGDTSQEEEVSYDYNMDTRFYNVDIQVEDDNSYNVRENIGVDFLYARHGIYRYIPIAGTSHYIQNNGKEKKIPYYATLTQISVSEDMEAYEENNNLVLQLGSENRTVYGEHTYEISYHFQPEFQETDYPNIYYNIYPAQWQNDIPKGSTFTLTLPKAIDASAVQFYYGNNEDGSQILSWNMEGNVITGELTGTLQAGQGLTFFANVGEGYFTSIHRETKILPVSIIFSLVLLGIVLVLFWFLGRDEPIIPSVQYQPPQGLDSAAVGYIVDGKVEDRDVVSLLIYWADKGYLVIKEGEKGKLYLIKTQDLPQDAPQYQKILFEKLFARRNQVSTDALQYKCVDTVRAVKATVKAAFTGKNDLYTLSSKIARSFSLVVSGLPFAFFVMEMGSRTWVSSGQRIFYILAILCYYLGVFLFCWGVDCWYGQSDVKRKTLVGAGVLVYLLSLALFAQGYVKNIFAGKSFSYLPALVVMLLAGVAMGPLTAFMKKRTSQCVSWMGYLAGLRDFIETAELDRMKVLAEENPQWFYHIIPYAYVFGISDIFAKKMEGITLPPPNWYQPTGRTASARFNYYMFHSSLMGNMHRMTTTLTTAAPRESSGGGMGGGFSGGGGGFSGGGFGGGGGGSW